MHLLVLRGWFAMDPLGSKEVLDCISTGSEGVAGCGFADSKGGTRL